MTDEDLRNLLDEATPGPWHSEEKAGMKAIGQPASIGVWSEHKFNAALALDDDDIDPEDEAWLAGIWGSIDNEDRANARLIAAAPDLAAEVLRLRAAMADRARDNAEGRE